MSKLRGLDRSVMVRKALRALRTLRSLCRLADCIQEDVSSLHKLSQIELST